MEIKIRELVENKKEKNMSEEKKLNLSFFSEKSEKFNKNEIYKYRDLIEKIIISDKNLVMLENKEQILEILFRLHEIKLSADEINSSKISKCLKNLLNLKANEEIITVTKKLIFRWKAVFQEKRNEIEKIKKSHKIVKEGSGKDKKELVDLRENDSIEEENKKNYIKLLEQEKVPHRKSSKILIFNAIVRAEKSDDFFIEKTDQIYEKYYKMTLEIEEGVFNYFKKESTKYLKHVKSIVMNLQSNKDFVERILTGQLIANQIGAMNPQDFASEETKQRRKKLEEEAFNARRSDWNRINSQNVQGLYRCGKCKTNKTTYYQAQIRRADEPMTTFVSCLECCHSWKF